MTDYLARADSPLTEKEWEKIDELVVSTARTHLVGRKFIPVFGPFGVGQQVVANDLYTGEEGSNVDMSGDGESTPLGTGQRQYLQLPIIYKDFQIHWRDVETSRQQDMPLDCSLAAAATAFLADTEDDLIFNGRVDIGAVGILNVKNRNQLNKGDWNQPGQIFADVVKATEILTTDGFYGPYALVLSPKLFALANRVYENTGRLELEQIKEIVMGGVFRSARLAPDQAVLVSTGPQNMDLAVSQDLITAYIDTNNLNHIFRVMEMVALRIKRPASICTFE